MEISPVGRIRGLECSVGLCQLHSAAERGFRKITFLRSNYKIKAHVLVKAALKLVTS